jgi:hypothetical protein
VDGGECNVCSPGGLYNGNYITFRATNNEQILVTQYTLVKKKLVILDMEFRELSAGWCSLA